MNKNDILRIARSLYLQQTIARQLFAKFDINKELNDLDGSFSRPTTRIIVLFDIFIGFPKYKNYTQIIEKNGTDFTVYGISINGQIDKNISQKISGWANLANFFTNVSSQTVAPGQSFHASMKNIIDQVSKGIDLNYKLENEDQVYQKMKENNKGDESKASRQFQIWKTNQLLTKWQDNIVSALDRTIQLSKSIKLFTLSNKTNSIVSNLVQLRSEILDKISYYKNNNVVKLLDKTSFATAIQTIQTYINDNELVKTLLTKGKQTNSIKESSSDLLSRIVQHIDQLQQIILYLEKNKENQLAQGLLNAFNNSNSVQQLISNCNIFGFDCSRDFNTQFKNNNLLDYHKNMQKGGEQAGNWKAKIQTFIKFIKGIGDSNLKYSSWNNNYQLLKNRFQNNSNQLLIIDNFNRLVTVCKNNSDVIQDCRTKYMQAYNAVKKYENKLISLNPNSKQYNVINSQKSSKEQQMNKQYNILLSSVFTIAYQDILDNIITLDKKAMDLYGKKASSFVQGIAKNARLSIPYNWLVNTSILDDMINLSDAI